ncbi:MAG: archaemetzincin family Zn-dependent metalloprotease [Bacteroidota bacterium]|nr:archaemetzincin family Zn-dependent metalloprotease [Bacteroidota bacterium]MDP4190163.1 archaemetzincin family Zn-dependent metalloprotease [Bacteroidota bacterium]
MDINIAPIEFSNTSLLSSIFSEVQKAFSSGSRTNIISLPLEVKSAYYSDRGQYFSTQIIADTIKLTGQISGKVLLLVEFDLFVPVFTYVFGEAQLNGKHSIVSVSRLHEELYSGKTNENLLRERTKKEVLHELGHNFGLTHCKDWDCVMHQSQGVEEIDIKGSYYCKNCSKIIDIHNHIAASETLF